MEDRNLGLTESCHPVTINVPSKIPKKSYISARNDAAAILQTIRVQQELSNGHMPAQFNGVAGSRTPDDDSLVDTQSTRDFYDTPSSTSGSREDITRKNSTSRVFDRIIQEASRLPSHISHKVSKKISAPEMQDIPEGLAPPASNGHGHVKRTFRWKTKRAVSVPTRPKLVASPGGQQSPISLSSESARNRSASADNLLKPEPIGTLHIQLCHRTQDEQLIVTICRAEELEITDKPYASEPCVNPYVYIRGCILPGQRKRFKSKNAQQLRNPVWNEEFILQDISFSAVWQMTLRFSVVYRAGPGSRPVMTGFCSLPLRDLELHQPVDRTLYVIQSSSQASPMGDIHLSVCYQPDSYRIVFLVYGARDLPRSTIIGTLHSCTRIEMLYNDWRVSKQKTHLVRETHDPSWNDQLVFTLPEGNSRLQGVTFVVSLVHRDVVKGGHVVGRVELGWSSTCEELEHWVDIMNNPNRPIASWLALQSPD
ncbi:synaptotagmin-7 [Strongylocentrotus purpuratus]|uniref:C2 domain-containing protein n=1 Tax=Strongylocentrotus purpuratus TaxID=7668 RepID=A0A7M7PRU4_STRPU|nr:synaptotagmin-7 [Strongylocentrotus purpuratus]